MKTVLRNNEGKIEYVHYFGRNYLTVDDHNIVSDTHITTQMVDKAFGNPTYTLMLMANNQKSIEALIVEILNRNGYNIKYKTL